MKTEVFNLIILDESGSMGRVRRQTIDGCNETINTIKAAQEKFAETQDHYVSIFAFQSNGSRPSRFLVKNVPAHAAQHISTDDYEPYGCTPLFDAIGSTVADLKATVKSKDLAIGSVTIITDGEENSSRQYTAQKVAQMIEALKELGWNFNFIGANIDVKRYARTLNIDNSMEFCQDEAGTKAMFENERRSRMAYTERINACIGYANACPKVSRKNILDKLKDAASDYFTEE